MSDIQQKIKLIMQEAGNILLSFFNKPLEVNVKPNNNGLVTQVDSIVEKYLINELKKIFPSANVLAEESGFSNTNTNNDYCWVIDPLDGTTNFFHKIPHFCISIALTYKDEPIIGAIYQPLLQEFFYAQKGKGAFYNDTLIIISSTKATNTIPLIIGFSAIKNMYYVRLLNNINTIDKQTIIVRWFGSAALDLAYVACMRLDAIIFANLAWWDVAAGILLVTEAGGIVTDFDGYSITKTYKTVIAGRKDVHTKLISFFE